MTSKHLLPFALVTAVVSSTGCQHLLTKRFVAAANRQSVSGSPARKSASTKIIDKEYEAYRRQVQDRFLKKDFAWVDREAQKDRLSKERLPGGYWKLRVVYAALEEPALAGQASDGDWEDLLNGLTSWSTQQPGSVTAKVALASAWKEYAWKARGEGYADSVNDAAWQVVRKRLESARQALSEASSLNERCPYWYVTALWVGLGQGWEREALDNIFEAGMQLEPTFYYLHQAKATYLLPRWGGTAGDWEKFANESALKLGGHQGDIVFFAIYSQMLVLHGMDLMNTHQQSAPKLLAGYHSIEKLYGSSSHRLNEASFFACFGNDVQAAAELFARIGDDYDETVWKSKQNYEVFRQGSQMRAKSAAQPQNAPRPVNQTAPKN